MVDARFSVPYVTRQPAGSPVGTKEQISMTTLHQTQGRKKQQGEYRPAADAPVCGGPVAMFVRIPANGNAADPGVPVF